MKLMLLALFISNFALAAPLQKLASGYYKCAKPQKVDICDQKVIPKYKDGTDTLLWLEVSYVGDCGDQGPYYYGCDPLTLTCVDGLIQFKVTGKNKYRWDNREFDFGCDFKIKR